MSDAFRLSVTGVGPAGTAARYRGTLRQNRASQSTGHFLAEVNEVVGLLMADPGVRKVVVRRLLPRKGTQ